MSDLIKRYDIRGWDVNYDETADGDYVLYDDHQAEVERLTARVAGLEAALKDIVANASIIPDPLMEGQADGYLVPVDDIETARAALAAEKGDEHE